MEKLEKVLISKPMLSLIRYLLRNYKELLDKQPKKDDDEMQKGSLKLTLEFLDESIR